MFSRRIAICLAFAFAVLPAAGQDKATLKWGAFKKDAVFYETLFSKSEQIMKVAGTDVNQVQEQTFNFSWTVTEVDAEKKTAVIKQQIIGLDMKIDIGGSKIAYNSQEAKPAGGTNPLNKFFEELKKGEFKYTLNTEKMEVTKLEGHKEFVDGLVNANPAMKPLLDRILSQKALTDMAQALFGTLPNKEVKKADTWTQPVKMDMGPLGSYETTYTYTYEGKDKDNEKVTVKSSLKYTPPDAANQQGLPFKVKDAKLSGKDGTGTLLFDPKAGRLAKSEVSTELTGDVTIEIGTTSTPVSLTQKQKIEITISDTNPVKPKTP